MRWPTAVAVCAAAVLISFRIAGPLHAQEAATPPGKAAPIVEGKGLPPRASASDYSAHAQAGTITIGADFTGHTVNTQDGLLTTSEYVVIEAGVYGPPQARLTLSTGDFSLRINGSKKALSSEPYELVAKSLKDPDYEPPTPASKTGKTIVNTGAKDDGTDPNAPPPALVPVPFEVKRGWALRAKRDSLEIGDRTLPQAGLLFFQYSGGTKGLRSIELIYSGPAGKGTISIHP